MVAGSKKLLDDREITTDDSFNGKSIELQSGAKNLIILLEISGYTDGSYTAKLQHSPDGVNWFDLNTTGALAADGAQFIAISASSTFHLFRSVVTSTGVTTGATSVKAFLVHTENRL